LTAATTRSLPSRMRFIWCTSARLIRFAFWLFPILK
jgi:hypothetical protein